MFGLYSFGNCSVSVISRCIGAETIQEVAGACNELLTCGMIKIKGSHPVAGVVQFFGLTAFGLSKVEQMQKQNLFANFRTSKFRHVDLLKERETLFLLDVHAMRVAQLLASVCDPPQMERYTTWLERTETLAHEVLSQRGGDPGIPGGVRLWRKQHKISRRKAKSYVDYVTFFANLPEGSWNQHFHFLQAPSETPLC